MGRIGSASEFGEGVATVAVWPWVSDSDIGTLGDSGIGPGALSRVSVGGPRLPTTRCPNIGPSYCVLFCP